jgi:hypothetical protein
VVEIPDDDDDVPPPGWDQWASALAPAPEASAGALVARSDASTALGRPADGAGPLSSCAGPAARLEQEREDADAPPVHFIDALAEQGLWEELRDHSASLNWALNEALWIHSGPRVARLPSQPSFVEFRNSFPCFLFVRVFSDARPSRSSRWWQELERWTRERYVVLDRLDADFRWYRGQYEVLDALVEALRSPDRWLAYRAEALLDLPPEQGAQAAEGASAVERVQTTLVERDDTLHRAREDLEGAHSLASTWEAEVATIGVQLQQGRVALEETEGLKTALADKAATLTTAEEQLRQERAARQEAEGQLQRERATLIEARAALEQGRLAHEEALGQLQRKCAALEEARATLKKQEEEVSRLNGELVQISISHEDQRQALEEQEASYLKLQHEAEETRRSLEVEKKHVEGEFVSVRFSFVDSFFWDPLPTSSFLVRGFQACGPPWGTRPPGARHCRRPTTPLNRSWKSCGPPPSRPARRLRRAKRKPGARWQVAYVPSVCMSRGTCAAPFTWASKRPRRSGVPLSSGL